MDSYDSKGDHGLQYDARVDADFDEKKPSQWFFEEVKLKVSNIALSNATMNL